MFKPNALAQDTTQMTRTAPKAFTKNQAVHLISSWNNKNEFYVVPAVVTGCGQKKMTLVARDGGSPLGHDFRPSVDQWGTIIVVPGLTDEQALALGLELAAAHKLTRIGEHQLSIIRNQDSLAYCRSVQKDIEELKTMQPTVRLRDKN